MPKAKFKTPLNVGNINLYAVITIQVEIPREVELVAEALGVGKQERDNLCGQKLSEMIQLLGNDEEV
jgi:hypothetical protein